MLAAFLHICNDSNNSKLERFYDLVDEKSVLFWLRLRELEILDSINVQLQSKLVTIIGRTGRHGS